MSEIRYPTLAEAVRINRRFTGLATRDIGLLRVNGVDVSNLDTEAMLSIAVATANTDIDVAQLAVALRVAVERIESFDPRRHLPG